MKASRKRPIALALIACLGLLTFAAASAATGYLTQKPGKAGCISARGYERIDNCGFGNGLDGAIALTVSPDGKSVYVASRFSGVAIFDRDTTTGALIQKPGTAGCITHRPPHGTRGCSRAATFGDPYSITVSPDGKSVYFASLASNAIGVFDRDTTTGALTEKRTGAARCISEEGTAGACIDGVALDGASSITVSPDGKSVYVASGTSDAIAVFDRDTTTGALTQKNGTAGCISETGSGGACADGAALDGARSVTVSPDGKSVYVASAARRTNRGHVAVFDRDPVTGVLAQVAGNALGGASSVTVSPDGRSVYVASARDAVAVFDRDSVTGALTQKPNAGGCISETGSGGACADGAALDGARSVTVSPDGESVYVASVGTYGGVTVFDRDTATGALTQKAGTAGCISEAGRAGICSKWSAIDGASSVTVSPDGKSVYVASRHSQAVAVFDRGDIADGSASARKTQEQKGTEILVKVKAYEDLEARASGKVKVKKKSYKLKPQTKSVASGTKKTLKLKPKKSRDSKKIAKAMKKGKKATAKLTVKLTDEAGNKETTKLSVNLKR